jgi:hypothetical protein
VGSALTFELSTSKDPSMAQSSGGRVAGKKAFITGGAQGLGASGR